MAFKKDPDALLDYTFDWTAYLTPLVDTIATVTWVTNAGVTVTGGITVAPTPPVSHTTMTATAFISGGVVGTTETLTCRIVTASGRTDDRSISIKIINR